jgi:uncharacterized protein
MQHPTHANLDEIKKTITPLLQEAGVIRSSLFGSYVSGYQTEKSDIDILIEFPKGKSLLDLIDLEMKLEQKLGKKVDLLTYNSLSPYISEYVQNNQYPIL